VSFVATGDKTSSVASVAQMAISPRLSTARLGVAALPVRPRPNFKKSFLRALVDPV
jgi:hypothetical protein